jgi:CHAT domain-containing protein
MRRRILLAAAAVLVLLAGVTVARRTMPPRDVLAQVARAQRERPFAARLSIATEYRPCDVQSAPAGDSLPEATCRPAGDAPRFVNRLLESGESTDPDSLQAAGLAAFIWWDETAPSLDDAIERLLKAHRLAADPVPVAVDLSAAYLVHADRTRNPRDLAMALEYAAQALALEPGNLAALFNHALALESLRLDVQAVNAWAAYLGADRESPWASEARRRWDRLQARLRAPKEPPPGVNATVAEVDSFAAKHPQEARLLGWDDVLGDWGDAVLAGRPARADSLLALVERLGNALQRVGGDASLADAVRAIRAAEGDAAKTRLLARTHQAYAAGQAQFYLNGAAAADSFAVILDLSPPSPALVASARAFHAATGVLAGSTGGAGKVFLDVLEEVDTVRYPALVSRVRIMWGKTQLDQANYAEAGRTYHAAAGTFLRLGETELYGASQYLEGDAAYERGDTLEAYRLMHDALLTLRATPTSRWRHNLLLKLGECVAEDAMRIAAGRIQNEDVWVAQGGGNPLFAAEALMARARLRAVAGDRKGAGDDLAATIPILNHHGLDSTYREPIQTRLRYSRMVVALAVNDTTQTDSLDSAVEFFDSQNMAWLIPTLLLRSDIRRAVENLDGATEDLERATARIHGFSRGEARADLRAAMLDQVRDRFDQLVMLRLNAGDTIGALRVLERGRLSFGQDTSVRVQERPSAPRGQVAVEYALIDSTLLTWTLRDTAVHLVQSRVNPDTLRMAIERASTALETPGRDTLARPELQRLYDWLIRPVQERLGARETPVVILADGEIAGVPFAALRDARRGKYLIEDHPLRMASSLADTAAAATGPVDGVLLVANPTFDPLAYPRLDRLNGAGAEADSLSLLYPRARIIRDSAATRDAFLAWAPRVSVIHYAGHAVFDDARPSRSYLVLAGEADTGRLSADAVDSLRLEGVRLVVLSACRTLRARHGRSGGFAGLSGALLQAGAAGVVGSLWEVDDALTQPLMLAFHREYVRTRNAAAALRAAQLSMLHSQTPARRSPAAWAGFRYVGR